MSGYFITTASLDLTVEDLLIDDLLASPYVFAQDYVKLIAPHGTRPVSSIMELAEHSDWGIKVEGCEKLSPKLYRAAQKLASDCRHHGPVTCHLFISPQGSKSFPRHTDPDDVVIYMLKGQKDFELANRTVSLKTGDIFYIPRGDEHHVVNVEDSIMLSFGLELFTVDKM